MKTKSVRNSNVYINREDKHRFVSEKYMEFLEGKILDVGADQLYLKKYLPKTVTEYLATGLGDHPGQLKIDLEHDELPFKDGSFDLVMCLDVLEHIENIHTIFDKLCKISGKYVLISLPNPWRSFWEYMESKPYNNNTNIKFYGLPLERAEDRHKWFFSATEARNFIEYRSKKNDYYIINTYVINEKSKGLPEGNKLKDRLRRMLKQIARKILFREGVNFSDLYEGTLWFLLQKNSTRI